MDINTPKIIKIIEKHQAKIYSKGKLDPKNTYAKLL